jgi:hypothetical protein
MGVNLYGKDALRRVYDTSGHNGVGTGMGPIQSVVFASQDFNNSVIDNVVTSIIVEGTRPIGGHRTVTITPVLSARSLTDVMITITLVQRILGRGQLGIDHATDNSPTYTFTKLAEFDVSTTASAIEVTSGAIADDSNTYYYADSLGTTALGTPTIVAYTLLNALFGTTVAVSTGAEDVGIGNGEAVIQAGVTHTGHDWGVIATMEDPGGTDVGNFLISTGS